MASDWGGPLMFDPSKLSHLLEDRVTVGKGLEEPLKAARAKTQAEPFSLESLIAWLETKDAEGEYEICQIKYCLLAQYTEASGGYVSGCRSYYAIGDFHLDTVGEETLSTVHSIAYDDPHTFGAALTRAQAALERSSSPILISEGV